MDGMTPITPVAAPAATPLPSGDAGTQTGTPSPLSSGSTPAITPGSKSENAAGEVNSLLAGNKPSGKTAESQSKPEAPFDPDNKDVGAPQLRAHLKDVKKSLNDAKATLGNVEKLGGLKTLEALQNYGGLDKVKEVIGFNNQLASLGYDRNDPLKYQEEAVDLLKVMHKKNPHGLHSILNAMAISYPKEIVAALQHHPDFDSIAQLLRPNSPQTPKQEAIEVEDDYGDDYESPKLQKLKEHNAKLEAQLADLGRLRQEQEQQRLLEQQQKHQTWEQTVQQETEAQVFEPIGKTFQDLKNNGASEQQLQAFTTLLERTLDGNPQYVKLFTQIKNSKLYGTEEPLGARGELAQIVNQATAQVMQSINFKLKSFTGNGNITANGTNTNGKPPAQRTIQPSASKPAESAKVDLDNPTVFKSVLDEIGQKYAGRRIA